MISLLKYLKPYKKSVAIVIAVTFLQVLTELFLPSLNAEIINTGVVNGDIGYIIKMGFIMFIIAICSTACAVTANLFASKSSTYYARDLREKIFVKIESFSLAEFEKISTSSLITRTTNDITQIQNAVMMVMRMMIGAPVMFLGGVIMIMSKNLKMTLILLIVIPLIILVAGSLMSKGMPLFKVMQKKIDKVNQVIRENLNGIRVIRAFDRINYEKKRFDDANEDLMDTAIKVNRIITLLMPALMLIMNFTNIAIMWFGGIQVDRGFMQVGDLTAFTTYMMLILMSIMMASMLFVMIPRASASAERINEVLNIVQEIKDPSNSLNHTSTKKGYIEFNKVYFSYPGADEPVLTNISFSASPGETTAIIGSTGSGKSTILNLIPRFYDVTSGSIKIDGIDIRDISQKELRAKVGIVPQKAFLFSGTIEDNLKYGKEDATEDELNHVLEISQSKEFVSEMKYGIKSEISQGGTNVSGGQKQRLSIARTLIKKPEIYLFDDSFSALDFKTDAKLRAALKSETQNSTVIIVAQRVSSIMNADRIIVLDEGNIVGIGKHKELLKNCDIYKEIVNSQLSDKEADL